MPRVLLLRFTSIAEHHPARKRCVMRTALAAMLLVCAIAGMSAQDVPPTSIRYGSHPVPDSLLEMFSKERPAFLRGFNWGTAPKRINEELHANFWHVHNPFMWAAPEYEPSAWTSPLLTINQATDGMHLVVAPDYIYSDAWVAANAPWYKVLDDSAEALGTGRIQLNLAGGDPIALTEGMGIRFQPELDLGSEVGPHATTDPSTFTPVRGDEQGAVFGFRTRRGGVVEGQRFVVRDTAPNVRPEQSTTSNYPRTVILDASWPNQRFALWTEEANRIQTHPFNGKRMYLAINLRRIPVNPRHHNLNVLRRATSENGTPLTIRLTYKLCGDTTTRYIAFDSLPNADGARRVLPKLLDTVTNGGYRGQVSLLRPASATKVVISNSMLPPADAEHPDITVLAHFVPPAFRDNWRVDSPCGHLDAGLIHTLNVQVEYAGGTDLAIDWVQVGTENMTWLTQGWYDRFADTVYRRILRNLRAHNMHRPSAGEEASRWLRIYKWYNRDEGSEQYWEGMRYMHLLFDSATVTERAIDADADRFSHATLAPLLWQGNVPAPNQHTVAPYYQHGYNPSMRNRTMYLENEWGMKNMALDHRIDYDARWGEHADGTVELPADTTIRFYPGGPVFASGSWQQRYESLRYQLMRTPQILFQPRPWIANPWIFSQWQTDDTNSIPVPFNSRPPTGEEVRLELYSQLILGAKGYAIYWGTSKPNAVHTADYATSIGGSSIGLAYAPHARPMVADISGDEGVQAARRGVLRNGYMIQTAGTYDSLAIINAPLHGIVAGPDFLDPGDRTGLYHALDQVHGVPAIADTLGVAPNKLYIGMRSMRIAVKEVFDKTQRCEDTLARLQLVTWFSKGFRTWTLGDTSALARIMHTDARGIRTRHPLRATARRPLSPNTNERNPGYEPFDSSFVEVSLLRDTTRSIDSVFVLGVLNRRCNPFYYNDVNVDNFVALADYRDDMVRGIRGLYEQQGAREITLKFNYVHPDGRPRRLHIRTMGEAYTSSASVEPINTTIAQNGELRLPCQPGEARLLYVTTVLD